MLNPYVTLLLGLVFLLVSLAPFFLIATSAHLSKQKRVYWFFGGLVTYGVLSWLFAYEGYRLIQFNAIAGVVTNLLFPVLLPWVIYLFFHRANKP
jgi:drug/metabolite transporter superfamily protein YnfA